MLPIVFYAFNFYHCQSKTVKCYDYEKDYLFYHGCGRCLDGNGAGQCARRIRQRHCILGDIYGIRIRILLYSSYCDRLSFVRRFSR